MTAHQDAGTVLLVTERGTSVSVGLGLVRRVAHLTAALEGGGARVELLALMDSSVDAYVTRVFRTLSAYRDVSRAAAGSSVIVLSALGSPQMLILGILLSRQFKVVVDVCDSSWRTTISSVRQRMAMPALKSLITSVLLPVAAIARVKRTYITKADASFDKSLTSRGQVGVVGPNVPAELAELNGYYGPADQIVIPADFSSEHNHAGFLSLVEAVQSGRLVLASEIVIYGPQAPPGALPEKFRYAGFADSLREIYEGKCVVFAPNQNAVGMQNKVWEAVCAGRRVLAGANAAGGLVDSPLVSRYMDGTDLPGALENLVSGASNPDRCENWRENNILRGPKDADMFAFLVEGDSVL